MADSGVGRIVVHRSLARLEDFILVVDAQVAAGCFP